MTDTDVLAQHDVDRIRYRVWLHLTRSVLDNQTQYMGYHHLWFPLPELGVYELREGNAPSDQDRPHHLRGLRLHIDVVEIPDWLREWVRPRGKLDDLTEEMCRDYESDVGDIPLDIQQRIRIELFDRVAIQFADRDARGIQ